VAGQLPDTVIPSSGTYSFTVKPGQGKLFRIAPAIGLKLGAMSSNLANNARHITPMEADTLAFAAVYERNGAIEVSYPQETPGSSTTKRIAGSPLDTKIDTVAFNPTPAIAFQATNKKIGVVYQNRTPAGADSELVSILYKSAAFSSDTSFSARKTIASFKAAKNFRASPAIAPHTDSLYNFWISWNNPVNGGSLAILNAGDTVLATTTFFDHDPTKAQFVSIATHTLASDSVYIGTGEDNQIYFGTAWYDAGANIIRKSADINVSSLHPFCSHYHPEITVTKNKHVALIWESNNQGIDAPATNCYSIYKERDGAIPFLYTHQVLEVNKNQYREL
jgi:hypothetical protein